MNVENVTIGDILICERCIKMPLLPLAECYCICILKELLPSGIWRIGVIQRRRMARGWERLNARCSTTVEYLKKLSVEQLLEI